MARIPDDQIERLKQEVSLQRLADCKELREVLGESFVDIYVGVKEVEFDNFLNVISPWEREHLLLKV